MGEPEPDAALRSASPLGAASLRAADPGSQAMGEPRAALERKNGTGKTKAERERENIRLFLEREATVGAGLKTLDHWDRWFPRQYDRAMLADVFSDVKKATNATGAMQV